MTMTPLCQSYLNKWCFSNLIDIVLKGIQIISCCSWCLSSEAKGKDPREKRVQLKFHHRTQRLFSYHLRSNDDCCTTDASVSLQQRHQAKRRQPWLSGRRLIAGIKKITCQWNNTEVSSVMNFNIRFFPFQFQQVYTVHNIIQIRSKRQIDTDT